MFIHHITEQQIDNLKEIFAVLTPEGWAIPEWIVALEGKYDIVERNDDED